MEVLHARIQLAHQLRDASEHVLGCQSPASVGDRPCSKAVHMDSLVVWNLRLHPSSAKLLLEKLEVQELPAVDEPVCVDLQVDEEERPVVDECWRDQAVDLLRARDASA